MNLMEIYEQLLGTMRELEEKREKPSRLFISPHDLNELSKEFYPYNLHVFSNSGVPDGQWWVESEGARAGPGIKTGKQIRKDKIHELLVELGQKVDEIVKELDNDC
jgi:hypothetical protein